MSGSGVTPDTEIAIQDDPEFFYGLTMWRETVSAQFRGDEGAALVIHPLGGDCSGDLYLSIADARRLRDLLNVATERRFL